VARLRETEEDRRLRHAGVRCPTSAAVHPDHRGEQTLSLITHGNFRRGPHQGRAFVGTGGVYRYAGLSEQNEPPALMRALVPPAMVERARVLGAAFKVAHSISAARPGVLRRRIFRSSGRNSAVFEHPWSISRRSRRQPLQELARLVGRTGDYRAAVNRHCEQRTRRAVQSVLGILDASRSLSSGARSRDSWLAMTERRYALIAIHPHHAAFSIASASWPCFSYERRFAEQFAPASRAAR